MLLDDVTIEIRAGNGGAGKVSFGPGRTDGPDGGNGGRGGDFYVQATTNLRALNQFSSKKQFAAEDGFPGMKKKMYGKDGEDLTLHLPVGTTIIDLETDESWEIVNAEDMFILAKGGKGGKGNFEFRSSVNTTPRYAQPGAKGDKRYLRLQLKFLAEFGLVGLPNAGKSSLLNELTNAKATVGAYAFTTLEPNLGVLHGKVIADIPGLIEGASQGRGLGIKFLQHIEKVSTLIHCIRADSEDVMMDYETIMNELSAYSPTIAAKPQIIVLTQSDLIDEKRIQAAIKTLKKHKHQIFSVSIHDWESIEQVKKVIGN